MLAVLTPTITVMTYCPFCLNKMDATTPDAFTCAVAVGVTTHFTESFPKVATALKITGSPCLILVVFDAVNVTVPCVAVAESFCKL